MYTTGVRLSVGGQTSSKSRASKAELPQVAVVDTGFTSSAGKVRAPENMGPEYPELLDPSKLLTSSWDLG